MSACQCSYRQHTYTSAMHIVHLTTAWKYALISMGSRTSGVERVELTVSLGKFRLTVRHANWFSYTGLCETPSVCYVKNFSTYFSSPTKLHDFPPDFFNAFKYSEKMIWYLKMKLVVKHLYS